jgi:selenocysteine lyase/cysteine desulfurase
VQNAPTVPVQKIVFEIERSAEVRFVVVDGAQDFCHVGSDLSGDCADLYLAGSHKWLGGYNPLGLAFYGKSRLCGIIEMVLQDMHVTCTLLRRSGACSERCP